MALAPTPNPAEVATIIAGGRRFDDWTSVMVQHRYSESCPLFRFTAVERGPPSNWITLRFIPGEECTIYLGGILAIVGVIKFRQVAYDAQSHGVQLAGKGVTDYAARSSIIDETGDYDGLSFEQVARKVIAPFGIKVDTVGVLDATPFKGLQIEPGQLLWDTLERLARVRGIVLGSDHLGSFLLIGEHNVAAEDRLIEGVNILKMQCVVSVEHTQSEYLVRASSPATDQHNGAAASQLEGKVTGTAVRYSPLLTPAEQPVWSQAEVTARARNESIWHEGDAVQVNVTVQGWLRNSGDLWRAGGAVHVTSPMAIIDTVMMIQSATFAQDDGAGTTTQLELVPPFLLRGKSSFAVGQPGVPQDPVTYEKNKPAAVATKTPEPPPLKLPS